VIRVARPHVTDADGAAVAAVLASGFLTQGQHVARFEGALVRLVGAPYAVAVSSGTAALHLALLAAGVGPGDEVVTSAFTFPATANVVELVGAHPVLVDIDLETFTMDVAAAEDALTPRSRALLPVHAFGLMADMEALGRLAARRNLIVVEDAACALGASQVIDGRSTPAGAAGDLGCFSFHPRKSVTTGEGGAVTTSDATLAARLRRLRNHGLEPGPEGPDVAEPGFNYRMTELQAALGLVQVERLAWALAERRRLAALYDEVLADLDWLQRPHEPKHRVHAWQSYVVLLAPGIDRERLVSRLKAHGIEAVRGAYAVHRLRFYRDRYGYTSDRFPAASAAHDRALALPLWPGMGTDAVEQVARALVACR